MCEGDQPARRQSLRAYLLGRTRCAARHRFAQLGEIGDGRAKLPRHCGRLERFGRHLRSEEHTSELQSLMRPSYAVFCLKNKKRTMQTTYNTLPSQTRIDI